MEATAAADECNGNFKNKMQVLKHKGPKLVYSAKQQKVLEMLSKVCMDKSL